jgi:hypothetical protein
MGLTARSAGKPEPETIGARRARLS